MCQSCNWLLIAMVSTWTTVSSGACQVSPYRENEGIRACLELLGAFGESVVMTGKYKFSDDKSIFCRYRLVEAKWIAAVRGKEWHTRKS